MTRAREHQLTKGGIGNREKQERGYMIDGTYKATATRNCNARNELEDEDEDENAQIVLP